MARFARVVVPGLPHHVTAGIDRKNYGDYIKLAPPLRSSGVEVES
jgi:hypothetical protein